MQIPKLTKMGAFQLLAACLLVASLTAPGEAGGPMLIIKGGHGGGGGAASILAAGIVVKLLSHLAKQKHHGGGYAMPAHGMGHSFASHDAHLQDYGYEPQGYAWAK